MAWAVGGYFMADLIILYYTHWLKANLDFKYINFHILNYFVKMRNAGTEV